MKNEKVYQRLTVGELKSVLADVPDEAVVLIATFNGGIYNFSQALNTSHEKVSDSADFFVRNIDYAFVIGN